jgi:mannose-6-phosphate isomerase
MVLDPHYIQQFYRASGRLGAFRAYPGGEYDSEEWIGSTTQLFGAEPGVGLTRLASGKLLRDVVMADPVAVLGSDHVARFGASTELLVKILDAGERLPVHIHPDRHFAHAHLGGVHGKSEAWIILEAPQDAAVYVGFRGPLERSELIDLMERQDSAAMLDAMHRLPVTVGDAVFVPAGVPHAIGEGLLLIEVQEPTDYSMLMEWNGYKIDAERTGRLGLTMELAVEAINSSGLPFDVVSALRRKGAARPNASGESVLPASADPYFRAERMTAGATLGPAFSIIIVTEGKLTLTTANGVATECHAGGAVLIPFSAGTCVVAGTGQAIRCRPPAPEQSLLARNN